jgi:6-phosphogluconate dehydrogenase
MTKRTIQDDKCRKKAKNNKNDFGVIGLGRMGGGLALQGMSKGMSVSGMDPGQIDDAILENGLIFCDNQVEFIDTLQKPRVIFLYVHSGSLIDRLIDELKPLLDDGDIIVDGGNSYWGDSITRAKRMLSGDKRIHFVDCGTSGGIHAARTGACFMVGGAQFAINRIEPILKDLCVPGGYCHCGVSGTGHFTKLVHNGIEFGMMQAIGEGMNLLTNFDKKLDISKILGCWRNGSVIRSWLVDLMQERLDGDSNGTLEYSPIPSHIEDTGKLS